MPKKAVSVSQTAGYRSVRRPHFVALT